MKGLRFGGRFKKPFKPIKQFKRFKRFVLIERIELFFMRICNVHNSCI